MSKAYDKVQYDILLNKLYKLGIRGTAHKWFASYLKDRQQCIEMEHFDHITGKIIKIRSESNTTDASIPQGSVIGCLLFILYINDLPKTMDVPCVLFADDISILTTCENNINLNSRLESILDKTNNWLSNQNLEINFNKTKLMVFHPYQKTSLEIDFCYRDKKLEVVNEFSLLGLIIDTHVNWKSHIKKIKSKISSFVYALSEIKKCTDLKTALATYYAYANAWFSYGIILWGNSTDVSSLFTLQKKLIRILVNIDNRDSCKPHFKNQKILTLTGLYILEVCKFVRNYPQYYKKREDIPTTYNLRYRERLMLPSSNLKMHSDATYTMSVKVYNKLPDRIKTEKKHNTFIKILREFLINKSYYTLREYLEEKL